MTRSQRPVDRDVDPRPAPSWAGVDATESDLGEPAVSPSWRGDVSVGVDAWTQRSERSARSARSGGAEGAAGADGASRSFGEARSSGRRGSRARGGSEGRRQGRSRSSAGQPPPDRAALGPEADPESVARTILLDQLTGRARSRKELGDKLAQREVPDEIATALLDRFEEVGLIDDEAFARLWVSSRGAGGGGSKSLARRALSQELRRKGVDDEVARTVLDEIDPDDEEQAARELVRKKLRSLSRVDDVTATRRLVGMLARKGYGSGLAFSVVKQELAASGRDEPDPLD